MVWSAGLPKASVSAHLGPWRARSGALRRLGAPPGRADRPNNVPRAQNCPIEAGPEGVDPRARRCGALGRQMACGGALSWSIPRSGALRRFGARPDLAKRPNNVPRAQNCPI